MSHWYGGWHNNIPSTAHECQKILQSRSNTQVEVDWTQQVKVTPSIAKEKAHDFSHGLIFFSLVCQHTTITAKKVQINIWVSLFVSKSRAELHSVTEHSVCTLGPESSHHMVFSSGFSLSRFYKPPPFQKESDSFSHKYLQTINDFKYFKKKYSSMVEHNFFFFFILIKNIP